MSEHYNVDLIGTYPLLLQLIGQASLNTAKRLHRPGADARIHQDGLFPPIAK